MKQWQSDPLQGMTVYNVQNVTPASPRKVATVPIKQASATISRSYRQLLETLKPKEPTGNGQLKPQDAAELLRRFK